MSKRSARKYKEILLEVKEQMADEGNAVAIDPEKGKYHTVFTRQRNTIGVAPRESGQTKKQAVSRKRRELIRKERAHRYNLVVNGKYESALKFEHTQQEKYGGIFTLNDKASDMWRRRVGITGNPVLLLIGSASCDVGNEGRFVEMLTPAGDILRVRAGWIDPA